MSKKIVSLISFIAIGFMPFILRCVYDFILGVQIRYINYYSEIFTLSAFIFAYNFINYSNKMYLTNKLNSILQCVVLLNFTSSTCIYVIFFYDEQNFKLKKMAFIILIVLTLFNLIATLIITITSCEKDDDRHYSFENRYEKYLLDRMDKKFYSNENLKSEKIEEKSNDNINLKGVINGSDILAEMFKNHIEIKEYFKISKNQSKFSFYFSIVSSVVGIIVVIIAASGMIIFKSLGISIIAAVSGAITEIISGIVLWIHNKSALQLNYYYDSLHENEKFLSAVNIADKLSEEKKEDMYIEIIRKQIDIRSKDKENKTSDTDKK